MSMHYLMFVQYNSIQFNSSSVTNRDYHSLKRVCRCLFVNAFIRFFFQPIGSGSFFLQYMAFMYAHGMQMRSIVSTRGSYKTKYTPVICCSSMLQKWYALIKNKKKHNVELQRIVPDTCHVILQSPYWELTFKFT